MWLLLMHLHSCVCINCICNCMCVVKYFFFDFNEHKRFLNLWYFWGLVFSTFSFHIIFSIFNYNVFLWMQLPYLHSCVCINCICILCVLFSMSLTPVFDINEQQLILNYDILGFGVFHLFLLYQIFQFLLIGLFKL